ncbi:hypothetical protein BJ742DRAFT_805563 [Cladochytrium replicatum]|nr:hypothetical protein BJ742DRAFT_805563 [Cladochytrium replicatum]
MVCNWAALQCNDFLPPQNVLSTKSLEKPAGVFEPHVVQLDFTRITGLEVPQFHANQFTDTSKPLFLEVRLSLYDAESGSFIGKTCRGMTKPINLRDLVLARTDPPVGSKHSGGTKSMSSANPRRKMVEQSDESDSGSESLGESDADSTIDSENEEVNYNYQSISGVTVDNNNEATIVGHSLSVKMKDQIVFLYAQCGTPSVFIVAEFVLMNTTEEPSEGIGVGWTFWSLFNAEKGGIDLLGLKNGKSNEKLKLAPLYYGSPRALMFMGPMLLSSMHKYPMLTSSSGGSFEYGAKLRNDLKHSVSLLKPNFFFGLNSNVPGLVVDRYSQNIGIASMEYITVSLIRFCLSPSVAAFEHELLDNLATVFIHRYPQLISGGIKPDLLHFKIIERRVLVGIHNTHVFITDPVAATLQKEHHLMDDVTNQDVKQVIFNGNIQLPKFSDSIIEQALLLVFIIEYKIKINRPAFKKSLGGLCAIKDMFGNNSQLKHDYETEEHTVVVGWGAHPLSDQNLSKNIKTTMNPYPGLNPLAEFTYNIPPSDLTNHAEDESKDLTDQSSFLLFDFEDLDEVPNFQPSPLLVSHVDGSTSPITDVDDQSNNEESVISQEEEIIPSDQKEIPQISSKYSVSRMERTRLLKANFADSCDSLGQKIYLSEKHDFDMAQVLSANLSDTYASNEINILFMGVSFDETQMREVLGRSPESLIFTFKFYNSSVVTSERLHLYTGPLPMKANETYVHQRRASMPQNNHFRAKSQQSHLSYQTTARNPAKSDMFWPGIIYPFLSKKTPNYSENPGLLVSYNVPVEQDACPLGPSRNYPQFLHYMLTQKLHIDTWDGDSLLHIGQASFDLKYCTRMGKAGIAIEDGIDIIFNRKSSNINTDVSVGKVHLRFTNVGRDKQQTNSQPGPISLILPTLQEKIITHPHCVIAARKISDVDSELKTMLLHKAQTSEGKYADIESRLQTFIRITGSHETSKYSKHLNHLQTADNRLDIISSYRERLHNNVIEQHILNQLTVKHTIHAAIGQAIYFEYPFKNIYKDHRTFSISWNDHDLRVITESGEIEYIRSIHNIFETVDEHTFNVISSSNQSNLGTTNSLAVEVCLKPGETLMIPFVFQTFVTSRVLGLNKRLFGSIDQTNGNCSGQSRIINVVFRTSNDILANVLAICANVQIAPDHHHKRLFCSENVIVQKTLKVSLEPLAGSNNGISSNELYVRCSNPNVTCSVDSQNIQNYAIVFKYRVPPANSFVLLDFIVYRDPFCLAIFDRYSVSIHSCNRLDLTCIPGQMNPASMVLKGLGTASMVQCYTSQPDLIFVSTPMPFMLGPHSLTEIQLTICPAKMTEHEISLNIVDSTSCSLINRWLVILHTQRPSITKKFDLQIARNKATTKRVSYTNPYQQRRIFYLHTDKPDLLDFREDVLDMNGGQTLHIGLRFLPNSQPAGISNATEILIFLNDENNALEECLCINTVYV